MTPADIATVTALVRSAGTSFYYGMKILPAARRDAMYGIYAFCRVVDDIADEDGAFAAKRAALDAWRARIGGLYRSEETEDARPPAPFQRRFAPSDPSAPPPDADLATPGHRDADAITRVLSVAVREYDLREADFRAIIDGMEMDAGPPIIAPSLAELDLYCDRVAAAVGRLSVRVFGDASAAAQEVAFALGRALQLTNILRDVAEDAARGRLYLPLEFLRAAGIAPDPALVLGAPGLPAVCARIAAMAEANFQAAAAAMSRCDRKAMRPARLMAASYRPLLKILRNRSYRYTGRRAALPKWRKLVLAGRLLVK